MVFPASAIDRAIEPRPAPRWRRWGYSSGTGRSASAGGVQWTLACCSLMWICLVVIRGIWSERGPGYDSFSSVADRPGLFQLLIRNQTDDAEEREHGCDSSPDPKVPSLGPQLEGATSTQQERQWPAWQRSGWGVDWARLFQPAKAAEKRQQPPATKWLGEANGSSFQEDPWANSSAYRASARRATLKAQAGPTRQSCFHLLF